MKRPETLFFVTQEGTYERGKKSKREKEQGIKTLEKPFFTAFV